MPQQIYFASVSLAISIEVCYQKVLIDLEVALVVGKVRSSVEGCEAFIVALVDLCTQLQQMVDLQAITICFIDNFAIHYDHYF